MIEFTCPKCGEHRMEEIQVGMTVSTDISLAQHNDGSVYVIYGAQTNEEGYVARYACKDCGRTILDDNDHDGFTEDGLDEHALAKKLNKMAAKTS